MKRSIIIRRILLASLLVAVLILKFYDSKHNKVSKVHQDFTKKSQYVTFSETDTIWFSHSSIIILDKPSKYLHQKAPKLLAKGKIGFEFYNREIYRKLEMELDGKIKIIDMFSQSGIPAGVFNDTFETSGYNYKLIGGYQSRITEEPYICMYQDLNGQSIIEAHYFGGFNNLRLIKVYTNDANHPFSFSNPEKLFLKDK